MRLLLKTLPLLIEQNNAPEMRQAVIFAIWPSAIGKQLNEHSRTVDLNERILKVAVPDTRWKREFEHHAAQIVYKLNAAAGRSIVSRINCIVDESIFKEMEPLSLKPSQKRLNAIDPKVMKAASRISDIQLRNNFVAAASSCLNKG